MSDYDQEEIISMISDCHDRDEKLTDWEISFIASIDNTVTKGYRLTELQQERLTDIWERIT